MTVWTIICILFSIFLIYCFWKLLAKAKLPGWAILIPIYNIYIIFKLAGRPGGRTWWILFPPVLSVLMIIAHFDIAERFGKGTGFAF